METDGVCPSAVMVRGATGIYEQYSTRRRRTHHRRWFASARCYPHNRDFCPLFLSRLSYRENPDCFSPHRTFVVFSPQDVKLCLVVKGIFFGNGVL